MRLITQFYSSWTIFEMSWLMATYDTPSHIAYLWPAKMSQGVIPYTQVNKCIRLFPNLQVNMRLIISDLCCFFLWLVRRVFRDFAWVESALVSDMHSNADSMNWSYIIIISPFHAKLWSYALINRGTLRSSSLLALYKGRRAGTHYVLENDLKSVLATSLYDCPHRN